MEAVRMRDLMISARYFTSMLPIKNLIELVGNSLVALFSFLTLIGTLARSCSVAARGARAFSV
jgi:hypothetical protein